MTALDVTSCAGSSVCFINSGLFLLVYLQIEVQHVCTSVGIVAPEGQWRAVRVLRCMVLYVFMS